MTSSMSRSTSIRQFDNTETKKSSPMTSMSPASTWAARDVISWLHTFCDKDNMESWTVRSDKYEYFPFLSRSLLLFVFCDLPD